MADERAQRDQFHGDDDANSGGGASASRGGRDAGMPGPDPGSGTSGGDRRADPQAGDPADRGPAAAGSAHGADPPRSRTSSTDQDPQPAA